MIYILDTDHVSLFQRRHPRVCQRIGKTSPRDLAVTIVTAEEQLRGWLSQVRRASSGGGRLVTAYARLQAAMRFFGSVQLLEFDDQANADTRSSATGSSGSEPWICASRRLLSRRVEPW